MDEHDPSIGDLWQAVRLQEAVVESQWHEIAAMRNQHRQEIGALHERLQLLGTRRLRRVRRALSLTLTTAMVLSMTTSAFAAIPDKGGIFHGCLTLKTGAIRLIDTQPKTGKSQTCIAKTEQAVSWNEVGPRGLTGNTGAQGPTGNTGAQGPIGNTGAQGPIGNTGAQGPIGNTGAQGPTGLNWRQAWDSTVSYHPPDAVFYGGSAWVAFDTNQNAQPGPQSPHWTLLAQQGNAGPQGLQGTKGDAGAAGTTGSKGDKGDTGLQGAAGPVGMVWRQNWSSTVTYVPNDAVFSGGAAWIALVQNTNSAPAVGSTAWSLIAAQGGRGDTGSQGIQGIQGIQGSKGDTGATGAQGAIGPVGPAGPNRQQIALLRWYNANNAKHTFTAGGDINGPAALAFDGANIWVANYYGNSVTKL